MMHKQVDSHEGRDEEVNEYTDDMSHVYGANVMDHSGRGTDSQRVENQYSRARSF